MPPYIDALFQFHPVGQGCFYSGKIISVPSSQIFNLVYDCGTLSTRAYLSDAVRGHDLKTKGEDLDLCIISHFDNDHVNGIPELLNGTFCRRLVIPYYEPIERLMVYIKSESDDDEYRRMLMDPIGYFSGNGFNVQEIIVIGDGGGPASSEQRSAGAPSPDQFRPAKELADNGNPESDPHFKTFDDPWDIPGPITEFKSQWLAAETAVNFEKVQVKVTPYKMTAAHWQFIFYCRKTESGSSAAIKAKALRLRNAIDAYFAVQAAIPASGVSTFSDLFNVSHLPELQRIYKSIYGRTKLNTTSLTTYHEPLKEPDCYHSYNLNRTTWPHHFELPMKYATMLTGDLELNSQEKLDLFLNYYRHYMERIYHLQVMHHGADKNWPHTFIRKEMLLVEEFIINHGAGRKSHPGAKVIKLLRAHRPDHVLLNNELTNVAYGYWFDRKPRS